MIELEQAKLPNGAPAFQAREIEHMLDVRVLIATVFPLALISGALLRRPCDRVSQDARYRDVVAQGLGAGSILTLVLLVGLIAYVLLNFDSFFLTFHRLFFEGDTFMFRYDDTLIRLYPEQLWSDAAILIGDINGSDGRGAAGSQSVVGETREE